jgi:LemA protein
MIYLWITVGAAIVLIIRVIIFNSLIQKRNRVKNAWSDIEVPLKRRYDLIPNLIEVVKSYKEYEASVLENIVKSRTNAISQSSISGKAQAKNILSEDLKSLFAVAENYPQLKASENFQKLQD